MDKGEIFSRIQKMLLDVPMVLLGTGATIPLGIPGMPALSAHLIASIDEKHNTCPSWITIRNRLNDKIDLESALADVSLGKELANDITAKTWELITISDIALLKRARQDENLLMFSRFIKKFYDTSSKCVNIITTNYDRAIEYACDLINVRVETKYRGNYIRTLSNAPLKFKDVVNLLKVHGSLDLFSDADNTVFAIPLQTSIPSGLLPVIVPPGGAKYETVLTDTSYRSILHETDIIINGANGFLCYGFGFNDTHIQAQVIEGIKAGKPITVITKAVSPKTTQLLSNSSKNFVTIEECPNDAASTRFNIDGTYHCLEGVYWTMEGLLTII